MCDHQYSWLRNIYAIIERILSILKQNYFYKKRYIHYWEKIFTTGKYCPKAKNSYFIGGVII